MDHLFATNNFSKPKSISGKDEIHIQLLRLLNMTPGTMPNNPDMGVGILTKFKFGSEEQAEELEERISSQILDYIGVQADQVTVELVDSMYKITIIIDNTIYGFKQNKTNSLMDLIDSID